MIRSSSSSSSSSSGLVNRQAKFVGVLRVASANCGQGSSSFGTLAGARVCLLAHRLTEWQSGRVAE